MITGVAHNEVQQKSRVSREPYFVMDMTYDIAFEEEVSRSKGQQ